ncbi:Hsp20/alpha crystallin family protein [Sinomonas humi]|uniref:Uncharacterized protein n=1 Tax=Sinomonas humi TaxID=1338436 RepID=A0A0B2AF98_9MICC|nr:hypothetical protein [Sinomonas humi]KHL01900.1 hypothetical protein LK10_14125 [Sinomonas humi]
MGEIEESGNVADLVRWFDSRPQREEKKERKDKVPYRSEFRYGSFSRTSAGWVESGRGARPWEYIYARGAD